MGEPDLVLHSFELAAESDEDITARVYQTFIAASPQSEPLMDHMDEHMLGRMMEEVLTVLMAEDPGSQRDYLDFEIDSHRAYDVEQTMYRKLLEAVRDTIMGMLGVSWNGDYQSAWETRMAAVEQEIDQAAAATS
jgi:hypothetical protein